MSDNKGLIINKSTNIYLLVVLYDNIWISTCAVILFTCFIAIYMWNCYLDVDLIKQHLNGLGIFCDSFFRQNLGKIISPLFSVRSKKN